MKRFYCFLVAAILFCACSEDWKNGKRLGEKPVLFPDYAQTTIPYNIPGGVILQVRNPSDEDLLYIKAKYQLDSGKEMEEAFAGGKR